MENGAWKMGTEITVKNEDGKPMNKIKLRREREEILPRKVRQIRDISLEIPLLF
jgi:hypothetical protein